MNRRIGLLVCVVTLCLASTAGWPGGGAVAAEPVPTEPAPTWVEEISAPQFFAVRVRNLEGAVAWYTRAFDLMELDRFESKDGARKIVNLTSKELFVELIHDDRIEEETAGPAVRAGFFKVGFRVADVAAVAERLPGEPADRPRIVDFAPHGIRILQLRDPDGNIIQLSSPLHSPQD